MAKVYLVGAGPGAPDLLTLRAARLLDLADIVFYDALVNPEILALAGRAVKIAVGKRHGQLSTAQHFINKRLLDAAQTYEVIVRLKGGDPMLFGRAQEEIDALQAAGIAYEVVPGITAALAGSAAVGVSLTRRALSRSVVFATPRIAAGLSEAKRASGWLPSVLAADTAVLYMAAGESADIAAALIAGGKPPSLPVAILRDISGPAEDARYTTLGELQNGAAVNSQWDTRPTLLCLGEVYREVLEQAQAACHTSAAITATEVADEHFVWPIVLNQRC